MCCEDYETPRHKKKFTKRKPKKSNHKHIYKDRRIQHCFIIREYKEDRYWVHVKQECTICRKENITDYQMSAVEYNDLKVKLGEVGDSIDE